jgi:putative ABC transport system permease protein
LIIAAGILLIACINFTTLSIGRSANRSKEVCVRKVIGGNRKTLTFQFLTESILLTLVSAFIGLLLANLLLPFFDQLSGRELHFSFIQFPQLISLILGLILAVGLLAGSYPAFVLSGFKPLEVLKAKINLGGSNLFTKSLITLQFVLSTVLIIATIIIIQQLHYMQSKNPGFNKDNIVVIDARGISNTKKLYALLKQQLSVYSEIIGVASADNGLGQDEGSMQSAFKYNGKDKQEYEYFIDHNYINVLGIKVLAGRNFDPAIASDTVTSVIINEAMMNNFGWTLQNAIGQRLNGYYDNPERDAQTPVVIGVVQNFNYLDLRQQVQPQMFQQFSFNVPHHFFVRIRPGDPSKALSQLQTAWKNIAPEYPLKYNFLDDTLNLFYESEVRWSNIIGWAGGISIFLACLGLLGLVTLTVANRTKEIGVRKVLGASLLSIISLISKEFLRIVVTAFAIAAPLTWYFMNTWLQDWMFLFIGGAIVSIALLVISIQSLKTALASPVKSLRTE